MKTPFIPEDEFTMDQLVERILADDSVPTTKRSTFASAANLLAKGSGVPLSAIATHPDHVRRHMKLLNPARLGVSKKTLSNSRSLLLWGLKYAGVTSGKFYSAEIAEVWKPLWEALPDKYAKSGLSRFVRYCSTNEIAPEDVNDEVSRAFLDALSAETLVTKPQTNHQTMCRLWNRLADEIELWPSQHLTVPRYFVSETLEWDQLPESFKRDALDYLDRQQKDDPLDLDLPPKPLRPSSVRKYDYMLRRCGSILLAAGFDASQLVSLATLVELDNVKIILSHLIEKAGETKKSTSSAEMARLLGTIAKYWVRVDAQHIDTIGTYASRLQPAADGVGHKNRERLAPLRDEKNLVMLLTAPWELIKTVTAKKRPSREDALLYQKALGLVILSVCPLRVSNLAGLDFVRHITWAELGMKGKAVVNIPAAEVKNGQALCFPLPDKVANAIRVYVLRFRPLLTKNNDSFLFTGPKPGVPKRSDTLSKQLTKLVSNVLGLEVNPHLYRHLVHLIVLRQFPGAFEMVSSLLGHKNTQTALSNYASENIAIAMENYDNLISERFGPRSAESING